MCYLFFLFLYCQANIFRENAAEGVFELKAIKNELNGQNWRCGNLKMNLERRDLSRVHPSEPPYPV